MRDLGKIAILSCNGTNGTRDGPTDDSTSSANPNNSTISSASSSGLSTGASAGIGTGVGVSVLGVLAVLAWLIVRYRQKLRDLATAAAARGHDDGGGGSNKQAAEAAPRAVQEVGGTSMPYQFGGGEIVESRGTQLPVEAGDVATSPQEPTRPGESTRSPVELA